MSTELKKNFNIQLGVVKRTINDCKSYVDELKREEERLEEMQKTETDQFKLNQQKQVIEETVAALKVSRLNLRKYCEKAELVFVEYLESSLPEENENEMINDLLNEAAEVIQGKK